MVLLTVSPAIADRWERDRRDDRRERREERRDRRDDRRERREERREERAERRADRRAHRAPPALRVERYDRRPGHVWISGHWDWNGDDYVWVGGRYEREQRGRRWREPRWVMQDGVYVSVDGGWINVGPSSAPPALRVERYDNRPGSFWVRGQWTWVGDNWVWQAGHYERVRTGHRYREPRWEQRDGAWISVEGTWEVGN